MNQKPNKRFEATRGNPLAPQAIRWAMNRMRFWAILCWAGLASVGAADACSYPEPPTFEGIAPKAKNIFVFQVMRLEYRQSQEGSVRSEWIEGTVRVVETFRGTPKFTKILFNNQWCGGVRLDVGHSYLMATNALRDPLELAPDDKRVLDISLEFHPGRDDAVETSSTLQRLLRALDGRASFKDVRRPVHDLMTSPIPGPP